MDLPEGSNCFLRGVRTSISNETVIATYDVPWRGGGGGGGGGGGSGPHVPPVNQRKLVFVFDLSIHAPIELTECTLLSYFQAIQRCKSILILTPQSG